MLNTLFRINATTATVIVLLLLAIYSPQSFAADDIVLAEFETTYGDWQATGDAFGSKPATGTLDGQQEVTGFRGRGLVNTFLNKDASQGTLTSPPILIQRKYLSFLMGGGQIPGQVGVELLLDGKSIRQQTGRNQEPLHWVSWDVSELTEQEVQIRIFDHATGDFGHINADHFLLTDTVRTGPGVQRLADYRRSPDYYRERYRPQLHFTPPMNWMNDPNGLVFFQGEYHLFYQHNPHGNTWGHMSWGHAVSRDLVHWEHLPIALHDEYGVMIFSGCCVVDHHNTSGFGKDGQAPLVAIYTGHGYGKQTQDLAYSTDEGRTWTKYAQNPVIDLNEADFRDPKVFWHEPTQKWIMVVSLAVQKKLQFYGSTNLKQWNLLSEFGPAGAQEKPNWECPDLFELPIEGQPGQSRWVLEVDMGNQAIAGGSGGEYFVGTFDGVRFTPDQDNRPVRWVDYGRDFYAPVSWSDIPATDGRRIWLGWMNNWETCLVPTSPWRSAMSVPRSLALRPSESGLRLVQTPVAELQNLRHKTLFATDSRNLTVDAPIQLPPSQTFELLLEFEPRAATEVRVQVYSGDSQRTVIGYNVEKQQMFVDRRESGNISFHPNFAGIHSGPLPLQADGSVKLQLLVDTSSVEVFGNDGYTVITDRIFPDPGQNSVSLHVVDGSAKIRSLQMWQLQSIWPKALATEPAE